MNNLPEKHAALSDILQPQVEKENPAKQEQNPSSDSNANDTQFDSFSSTPPLSPYRFNDGHQMMNPRFHVQHPMDPIQENIASRRDAAERQAQVNQVLVDVTKMLLKEQENNRNFQKEITEMFATKLSEQSAMLTAAPPAIQAPVPVATSPVRDGKQQKSLSDNSELINSYVGTFQRKLVTNVEIYIFVCNLYHWFISIVGQSKNDALTSLVEKILVAKYGNVKISSNKIISSIECLLISTLDLAKHPQPYNLQDLISVKKLLSSFDELAVLWGYEMNAQFKEDFLELKGKEADSPTFVRIKDMETILLFILAGYSDG